jgi:hypothetical protein
VPGEALTARAAPERAAGSTEPEDDTVTDRDEPLGVGAERLDHTDPLVTERGVRGNAGPVTAGEMEVGVTDARGADPHEGLPAAGLGLRDVTDPEYAVFDLRSEHGALLSIG